MDCALLNFECKLKDSCDSQVSFDDVRKFFSTYTNCSTTYVYVNQIGEGDTRDTLKVKAIDDCNILFTNKGNYYYCYDGLLTNIIVWARDPLAFGRQGFIGHHITIGWKNNNWDIHETIYSAFENTRGNLVISNNKKCVRYKVSNNQVENTSRNKSQYEEYVSNLWNEIRCETSNNIKKDGGGHTVHDIIKPEKSKITPKLSSKQLASIILHEFSYIDKNGQAAAIRVPYISKHKEKRVLALLAPHVKKEFILWSNHNNPSSFITIGLFHS